MPARSRTCDLPQTPSPSDPPTRRFANLERPCDPSHALTRGNTSALPFAAQPSEASAPSDASRRSPASALLLPCPHEVRPCHTDPRRDDASREGEGATVRLPTKVISVRYGSLALGASPRAKLQPAVGHACPIVGFPG